MATTPDSILDRMINPFAECLSLEAARQVADLRADPVTQAHIDVLADKADEGQLSDEERVEYDEYLAALHLITVLQAKARRILRDDSAA